MNLITKENPNAVIPILRFQVGTEVSREEQEPVYAHCSEDLRTHDSIADPVIGHRSNGEKTRVFKLYGFGRTRFEAAVMAVLSLFKS